jgi:hypothetical protein
MPTLGALREYAEAGVLMSYGPSYADHCCRAATYVDQILKGTKPGDLPVQLPTTYKRNDESRRRRAVTCLLWMLSISLRRDKYISASMA